MLNLDRDQLGIPENNIRLAFSCFSEPGIEIFLTKDPIIFGAVDLEKHNTMDYLAEVSLQRSPFVFKALGSAEITVADYKAEIFPMMHQLMSIFRARNDGEPSISIDSGPGYEKAEVGGRLVGGLVVCFFLGQIGFQVPGQKKLIFFDDILDNKCGLFDEVVPPLDGSQRSEKKIGIIANYMRYFARFHQAESVDDKDKYKYYLLTYNGLTNGGEVHSQRVSFRSISTGLAFFNYKSGLQLLNDFASESSSPCIPFAYFFCGGSINFFSRYHDRGYLILCSPAEAEPTLVIFGSLSPKSSFLFPHYIGLIGGLHYPAPIIFIVKPLIPNPLVRWSLFYAVMEILECGGQLSLPDNQCEAIRSVLTLKEQCSGNGINTFSEMYAFFKDNVSDQKSCIYPFMNDRPDDPFSIFVWFSDRYQAYLFYHDVIDVVWTGERQGCCSCSIWSDIPRQERELARDIVAEMDRQLALMHNEHGFALHSNDKLLGEDYFSDEDDPLGLGGRGNESLLTPQLAGSTGDLSMVFVENCKAFIAGKLSNAGELSILGSLSVLLDKYSDLDSGLEYASGQDEAQFTGHQENDLLLLMPLPGRF